VRLLVFSDIHGDLAALERVMATEADYYVAAGDLVNFGRGLDRVGPVLQKKAERVWVLPGNHESTTDIEKLCRDYGLHDFHGRSLEVDGWHVAGLGYSNITPFQTPGEYTEDELARRLEPFASLRPLVLICHCPPIGTALDEAAPGRHLGSTAVKSFLDRVQPGYFFCGHIHEAAGRTAALGATFGVNVGKRGYLLEFDKIES
jgi:uncharacterized protein